MPTNTNPAAATLSTTSREKRCRSFPIVPLDTVQGQTYTVIQSTPVLNGPFAYNGDTLSPEDVKAIQELFTSSLDNKSKVLVKDMLLKLKQEDTSMIGIFHDLEFMDGLCGIALNKKILAVSRSEILQGFFVVLILREQCCPPCVSG